MIYKGQRHKIKLSKQETTVKLLGKRFLLGTMVHEIHGVIADFISMPSKKNHYETVLTDCNIVTYLE